MTRELGIEVVKDYFNEYLDRREIILRIKHLKQSTPKRVDVLKYAIKRFSLDPDKTLLMYVKSLYGQNVSEALIYYYPNGIDWSTIEPPKRRKVIKIGEEESKEEG